MNNAGFLRLILITSVIISSHAFAIQHKFVAIDEGIFHLLYIDEFDSTKNWIDTITRSSARDMQLVGNNRILIGHDKGYTEYNLTTGAVVRELATYSGVTSVRRLPGGYTLLFGVNLDGSTGVIMVKLDSNNVKIKKTIYPGNYVRLVRQTNTGTFLMACNDTMKEADTSGSFIWSRYLGGTLAANKHMWKLVRRNNGNIFLSGGYGAFLAEVNSNGALVGTIGAAPQPTGVNPFFYAMFQIMASGNVVVANWQGHGPGHGASGVQLLEFTPAGAIVWQWSKSALISSLQGILVIDSLNTNLLYDERNGVMVPLTSNVSTHPPERALKTVPSSGSAVHARKIFTVNGRMVGGTTDKTENRTPGVYVIEPKSGTVARKMTGY